MLFMTLASDALGGTVDALQGAVLRVIGSQAFRSGAFDYPPPLVNHERTVRLWAKSIRQVIYIDAIQFSEDGGRTWQNPVQAPTRPTQRMHRRKKLHD